MISIELCEDGIHFTSMSWPDRSFRCWNALTGERVHWPLEVSSDETQIDSIIAADDATLSVDVKRGLETLPPGTKCYAMLPGKIALGLENGCVAIM